MTFSEILNILLGGGLLALVVGVITLRATVRKANADAERAKAEAERAKADAESVRITNTESATRILVENIVKPLKEELNATRKDLQATKREMVRLRKAVETAASCPHHDGCPVLRRLRDNQKDTERGDAGGDSIGDQHDGGHRNKADPDGDSAGKPGGDADTC